MRRFLAPMNEHEYFKLGLFQSRCDRLARAPLMADDRNRNRALAFLDGHPPTGGTELGLALEQALRSEPAPGERTRHVLIVTDAQVSDEGRIMQLVEGQAAAPSAGQRHLHRLVTAKRFCPRHD